MKDKDGNLIPKFEQVVGDWMSNQRGNWWCSYFEEESGRFYPRYLHTDGWRLDCYYWRDYEEMVKTFESFCREGIEVSASEERQYGEMEQLRRSRDLSWDEYKRRKASNIV